MTPFVRYRSVLLNGYWRSVPVYAPPQSDLGRTLLHALLASTNPPSSVDADWRKRQGDQLRMKWW